MAKEDEEEINRKEMATLLLEAEKACSSVKFKSDKRRCKAAYLQGAAKGSNSQKKRKLKDMSVKEILQHVWET